MDITGTLGNAAMMGPDAEMPSIPTAANKNVTRLSLQVWGHCLEPCLKPARKDSYLYIRIYAYTQLKYLYIDLSAPHKKQICRHRRPNNLRHTENTAPGILDSKAVVGLIASGPSSNSAIP
ncbi:hypothetical protein [Arthrobacter sp. MYb211]|uniref:hypothetical protein n=1 Tax=Arthrobacter sp. MYb211 TaxID=1848594 RepID=UPI001C6124C8|nr:hypothetical protein [Arthrobacter sp. MYb211]